MKRAEAFFDREEYAEAIIEYQHFLDLHRAHALSAYAQFKLGESHFKMTRTIDRDLEPVHKALEAYEKLLKDYPGNKYQTEARDRIHACQDFIAQAHYFVGKFYYRREAYLAAAHRFEAIVKEYPEMEVASDAMYDLARTYHDIGADDWAQEKLFALEQQYPNHKHKAESQKLYASLKVTQPATALAKATAPAAPAPTPAAALISGTGDAKAVAASDLATSTLSTSNGASARPASASVSTGNTFSDSLHRTNAALAQQPAKPVMTLASAKAPAPVPSLRAPAESAAPTPVPVTPQTTLCRMGAWC
jgi:outer membrane protein assembly factor BamD